MADDKEDIPPTIDLKIDGEVEQSAKKSIKEEIKILISDHVNDQLVLDIDEINKSESISSAGNESKESV